VTHGAFVPRADGDGNPRFTYRLAWGRGRREDARTMATYIYETIPQKKGQKPRRFEFEQKMSDPALTHDPETGLPVRRIITGGSGLVTRGTSILSMNRPKRR
jgi:predicted nucleic acid-binding Zn ribbon protein